MKQHQSPIDHVEFHDQSNNDRNGDEDTLDPEQRRLISTKTKQLNVILKTQGLDRNRSSEIKRYRRQLLNRRYARNCRNRREREKSDLERQTEELNRIIQSVANENKILELELRVRRDQVVAFLQQEIQALKEEYKHYTKQHY